MQVCHTCVFKIQYFLCQKLSDMCLLLSIWFNCMWLHFSPIWESKCSLQSMWCYLVHEGKTNTMETQRYLALRIRLTNQIGLTRPAHSRTCVKALFLLMWFLTQLVLWGFFLTFFHSLYQLHFFTVDIFKQWNINKSCHSHSNRILTVLCPVESYRLDHLWCCWATAQCKHVYTWGSSDIKTF